MNKKTENQKYLDAIQFDVAEKTNVANVLISNFASQYALVATAPDKNTENEHRVGLEIASQQLGSFVSNMITENGNFQIELNNLKNP